jgi:hypothetical protein
MNNAPPIGGERILKQQTTAMIILDDQLEKQPIVAARKKAQKRMDCAI